MRDGEEGREKRRVRYRFFISCPSPDQVPIKKNHYTHTHTHTHTHAHTFLSGIIFCGCLILLRSKMFSSPISGRLCA
jgi:hypothetical protein